MDRAILTKDKPLRRSHKKSLKQRSANKQYFSSVSEHSYDSCHSAESTEATKELLGDTTIEPSVSLTKVNTDSNLGSYKGLSACISSSEKQSKESIKLETPPPRPYLDDSLCRNAYD